MAGPGYDLVEDSDQSEVMAWTVTGRASQEYDQVLYSASLASSTHAFFSELSTPSKRRKDAALCEPPS